MKTALLLIAISFTQFLWAQSDTTKVRLNLPPIKSAGVKMETAGVIGLTGVAVTALGIGIATGGFIEGYRPLQYAGLGLAGVGLALNIGGFSALISAGKTLQLHKDP